MSAAFSAVEFSKQALELRPEDQYALERMAMAVKLPEEVQTSAKIHKEAHKLAAESRLKAGSKETIEKLM